MLEEMKRIMSGDDELRESLDESLEAFFQKPKCIAKFLEYLEPQKDKRYSGWLHIASE
jgi:hypothetical protein